MKLPIPVNVSGTIYTDVEVQAPTVEVAIETRKIADSGKIFMAMRPFCVGCIQSLTTQEGQIVDDPISIKSLVPKLKYKNVEYITIQSLLVHNEDDGIEGIYSCPRCGTEILAEYKDEDGIITDTRDHILSMPVNYFDIDKDSNEIFIELTDPVVIKDRKSSDIFLDVKSFSIDHPSLENYITAESKVGTSDPIKLQLAVYVESLKTVNGEIIDGKFRNEFGMLILGGIRSIKKDLGKLADEINKFGISKSVKKTCRRCGKEWEISPNTSNFFVTTPLSF